MERCLACEAEVGGARLPKGRALQWGESVDTSDLMGWVDRRAEPWPGGGLQLGSPIGLTHYVNWYPAVSPGETSNLSGASPPSVGPRKRGSAPRVAIPF